MVPGVYNYGQFLKAIRVDWTSKEELETGIEIVKEWMKRWNIHRNKVKTHNELRPKYKFDPGTGFPLDWFMEELV